jgi:hypothetical protein
MGTTIAAVNSNQIRYAEFVKIYNSTFSDYVTNAASNVTVNGMTFAALGAYMGISDIQQDMKSSSVDVKISITGLDPTYISQVLSSVIKGSVVTVWRGFLDSDNQIETIGGVQQFFQRYQGIVNNIAIDESFDQSSRVRTATCVISSASMRLILDSRIAGIRTNPSSWQAIYPNDTSMNRVPSIAATYFNFGGKPLDGSAAKVVGSTQVAPNSLVKFNN